MDGERFLFSLVHAWPINANRPVGSQPWSFSCSIRDDANVRGPENAHKTWFLGKFVVAAMKYIERKGGLLRDLPRGTPGFFVGWPVDMASPSV